MEAPGSLIKEFFRDGQVHRRRVGIDVPQERSEVHQAAVRIDALAVPAQQRGDREGMPQIVKSGW